MMSCGDFEEALKAYEKLKKIYVVEFGEASKEIFTVNTNIGVLHEKLGKFNLALDIFRKNLELTFKYHSEDDELIASTYVNIGAVLIS